MVAARIVALFLVAVGLALFTAAYLGNADFAHDDAFIALRYADNLAHGRGLSWNPGEPVEGYSSFVMVVLLAGLMRLGIDGLAAARAVSLVALLLSATLAAALANAPRAHRLGAASAALLVLGYFPLVIWSRGGLETVVFGAVVLVAFAAARAVTLRPTVSRGLCAGLALALLPMTRPDGAFLALVFLVFATVGARSNRAALAALWASVTVPLALHETFRVLYHGDIVPNTLRAKLLSVPLDPTVGRIYLLRWIASPPFTPMLFAAALLWLGLRARQHRPAALALAFAVFGYGGSVALGGGDHMPALRLLAPLTPLVAVTVGWAVDSLVVTRGARTGVLLGLGLVVASSLQLAGAPERIDSAAYVGALIGRHIHNRWPAGTVVALNTAGSTPYFAPRYTYIDMLGLNDRRIATRPVRQARLPWQRVPGHAKGDGAYVLAPPRHPHPRPGGGHRGPPAHVSLRPGDCRAGRPRARLSAPSRAH